MGRLLDFLVRFGNVFLFLLLEGISLYLIFTLNKEQKTAFIETSLEISGKINNLSSSISSYLNLQGQNDLLMQENLTLRKKLKETQDHLDLVLNRIPKGDLYRFTSDSLKAENKFDYVPCSAINNSLHSQYNYITIDKGRLNGVEKGQGVFSPKGIAGMVISISDHYSLVMSLLNRNFRVSAEMVSNGYFGNLIWDGENSRFASLENIPLHLKIIRGDKVVTSGYGTLFPKGFVVGTIDDFEEDAQVGFWKIKVRLATDFGRIDNLYLVKHTRIEEIDSLKATENNK